MMRGKFPYKRLGQALQDLRKKAVESLDETAGAVEIDSSNLKLYELGEKRPPEEILRLLASHFSVGDAEETELYIMGDYLQSEPDPSDLKPENMGIKSQLAVMLLPMDARIVYTDNLNVTVNNHGVVMNFMQNSGQNNQQIAISRVGMSLSHAKVVLEVLGKSIKDIEYSKLPKALPKPKSKRSHKDNK